MCGRYTLHADADAILELMELDVCPVFIPRYNIAPTQPVPVVGAEGDGKRLLRTLQWGLIPFWAKSPKAAYKSINARLETAAERPTFREPFRRRRCLMLADGFYEWRATETGKQPFHIRLREGEVFAFAGLWDRWKDEQGKPLTTCSILTKDSDGGIRDLHDRMPVVLDPEHFDAWLDPELTEPEPVHAIAATSLGGDAFEIYEVEPIVNNVRNEGPELIVPA